MHPLRILARWLLTLIALLLSLIAALVLSLRLGVLDQPGVQQRILSAIELPTDVQVRWQHLSLNIDGRDVALSVDQLALDGHNGERSLLSLGRLDARLDLWQSLKRRAPVVEALSLDEARVDLHEFEPGEWGWFHADQTPEDNAGFNIEDVTDVLGTLLAQRARIDDLRLRFHPLDASTQADAATQAPGSGQASVPKPTPSSPPTLLVERAFVQHDADARHLGLTAHWVDKEIEGLVPAARERSGREIATLERGATERALPESDILENAFPGAMAQSEGSGPESSGQENIAPRDPEPGFRLAGVFNQGGALDGQLQLAAGADSLRRLVTLLAPGTPYDIERAEGDLSLWASWHEGEFESSQLALDVSTLAGRFHDSAFRLERIALEAGLWRREDGGFRGALERLSLERGGAPLALLPQAASLQASEDFSQFEVRLEDLALDGATAFVDLLPVLDAESRRMIEAMALEGQIASAEIARRAGEPVTARAGIRGLSAQPVQEIPGYGPVDGWLEMEGTSARLRFSGRDVRLEMPEVFIAPWTLSRASGELLFTRNETGAISLSGENIEAERRGAHASGRFLLNAPPGRSPERFDLELEFGNISTDAPREWLPVRAVEDPEVRQWLDERIHRADIPKGRMSLNLVFNDELPVEADRDNIHVAVEARNASFTWLEGWAPLTEVDGHLEIAGERLQAKVTHANLMGLISRGASARLENQQFSASALVTGNAGDLLGLLQKAPLEDAELRESLNAWGVNGSLIGTVNLSLPTENPDAVTLRASGRVDDTRFYSSAADLTVTDVEGDLEYAYRDQTSQITGDLIGRVFEGPVRASLDLMEGGIALRGSGRAEGVAGWLGLESVIPVVHGEIDYRAQIDVGEAGSRLRVSSPLEGLTLQLPQPFQKAAGTPLPLELDVEVAAGAGDIQVGDQIRARWRNNSDQGQVWLENIPNELPDWPEKRHWVVNWRADRLDVEAWQLAISQLATTAERNSVNRRPAVPSQQIAPIEEIRIQTDCFQLGVTCLGSAEGLGVVEGDDWHIKVDSSFLRGEVNWRDDPSLPILARIAWLDLTPFMTEARRNRASGEGGRKTPPGAYPEAIANLSDGELEIEQVVLDERIIGRLSGRWHSNDEGLTVEPLTVHMPGVEAEGRLVWEYAGPEQSLTRLRLDAETGDLGRTAAAFGAEDVIQTDEGRLDARLAWPGAPWQFDTERVNASLGMSLGEGRLAFIQSRLANVTSLLNLDNLARRLQLDFSDVTRSGIAFESASGRMTLHEGVLRTVAPISFDGTATRFSADGQVDLLAQTLDMRLGVTVPVSQNLPLAAVLVGAPQVGGALYLLHWLFEPWLERVSQLHYNVEGPWQAPEVSLDQAR